MVSSARISFIVAGAALLLNSVVPGVGQEQVGFFVEERWRSFTDEGSQGCLATSCQTRREDGCLPSYNMRIEDACYMRTQAQLSEYLFTERYHLFNSTHYCAILYDDHDQCLDNATLGEFEPEECSEFYELGTCIDDDPSQDVMLYLPDFCIQSSVPTGDFVVPIVSSRIYASEDFCQEDVEIYLNAHFPVDPDLCYPSVAPLGGKATAVGATRTCGEDGVSTVERFSNRMCTQQNLGTNISRLWEIGPVCSEGAAGTSSDVRYSEDCLNPEYYCKDIKAFPILSDMFVNKVKAAQASAGSRRGDGIIWVVAASITSALLGCWTSLV